jgi:hypothetical protein
VLSFAFATARDAPVVLRFTKNAFSIRRDVVRTKGCSLELEEFANRPLVLELHKVLHGGRAGLQTMLQDGQLHKIICFAAISNAILSVLQMTFASNTRNS